MAIIFATDFSEPAEAAEAEALRLAGALDSELVFLHVMSEIHFYGEIPFSATQMQQIAEGEKQWANERLEARVAAARERGLRARMALRVGAAAEQIVAAAGEEKAEMIVIGTHGRTGLDRLIIGSVAERVVRLAPCPVHTVRPPRVARAKAG
jgi:nucleotide-binding universal stress UspA family protein